MRDYKFRGKRIDNGEWVFGDLIHSRTKVKTVIVDDEGFGRSVDPETVGQFVELKDLDGREIYEGDINEYEGKRFHIKWGINSNGFIAKTNGAHSNVYSSYHIVPKTKWIGTIHENPELLII